MRQRWWNLEDGVCGRAGVILKTFVGKVGGILKDVCGAELLEL